MRSSGQNLDERMDRSRAGSSRVLAIGVAAILALGACVGSTATHAPPASSATVASGQRSAAPQTAAPTPGPTAGGTIYILTSDEGFNSVDPQVAYGSQVDFFANTIYRSLIAYKLSPDPTVATSLTPDLATDLGTATDGGRTWSFTLRDGVTFQDGSPITCADVAYGNSRTFAAGPIFSLDIPRNADGSSAYPGPYKATAAQQALYDKAVTCSPDNRTITFHLNQVVADFNYGVYLGFEPVPRAVDTGLGTDGTTTVLPVASGPYKIESYTTGKGGKLVLVRNPNWSQASDPYRTPYPDKWEVDFGIDPQVIDQRLMTSSGNDAYAISFGKVQPENLAVIFADPQTPNPDFAGRAVSDYDVSARYFWINVRKVKNLKIRQAMAVALDRSAIRLTAGGAFIGAYADGVLDPSIGVDYAPTGLWDSLLGQKIPDSGDPAYAKQLITESGEPAPTLTYNFADDPTNRKIAAIVIDSLGKAGITVKPASIEPSKYYAVVLDPATAGDFGRAGWGSDWANASAVIPFLFTRTGPFTGGWGWDLSQVDDAAFNAKVEAALTELDRAKQAPMWQALNKEAMQNVWAIPTFFDLSQTIAGTKIGGGIYRWAQAGSWPYGAMYVKP
jgi:peptide/nickel transport system substrate-binding protein